MSRKRKRYTIKLARKLSVCNRDNSDSIVTMVKQSVVLENADANVITPQIPRSISSKKSTKGAKHDFYKKSTSLPVM